jgi:hypothetical protein
MHVQDSLCTYRTGSEICIIWPFVASYVAMCKRANNVWESQNFLWMATPSLRSGVTQNNRCCVFTKNKKPSRTDGWFLVLPHCTRTFTSPMSCVSKNPMKSNLILVRGKWLHQSELSNYQMNLQELNWTYLQKIIWPLSFIGEKNPRW